jgi:hypothetical protein
MTVITRFCILRRSILRDHPGNVTMPLLPLRCSNLKLWNKSPPPIVLLTTQLESSKALVPGNRSGEIRGQVKAAK